MLLVIVFVCKAERFGIASFFFLLLTFEQYWEIQSIKILKGRRAANKLQLFVATKAIFRVYSFSEYIAAKRNSPETTWQM